MVCSGCYKQGKARHAGKWLVTLCPAAAQQVPMQETDGVHVSHTNLRKSGICSSCGYYTVRRVIRLKEAGRGILTKARKDDSANWAIDIPPKGISRWPVFPPGEGPQAPGLG